MTFFLLIVSLVAVSILALYRVLHYIRCPITYTALIVAVLLSVLVTFLGIRFIPFLTDAFYWSMAVMVLIAALFTTILDAYLLRGKVHDGAAVPQRAAPEKIVSTAPQSQEIPVTTQAHPSADAEQGIPVGAPRAAETPVAAPSTEDAVAISITPCAPMLSPSEAVSHAPPSDPPTKPLDASLQAPVDLQHTPETEPHTIPPDIPSAPHGETTPDPAAPPVISVPASPDQPDTEQLPIREVPATSTDASLDRETHPPTGMQMRPSAEAPIETSVTPQEVATVPSAPVASTLLAEFDAFCTLDHYLDFAFQEERAGRTAHAICAYKRAMDLYADDDYAPFIAIELANVCKELGDFQAAAASLQTGLRFSAVRENLAMMREFEKNIRFLTALHQVLADEGISRVSLRHVPKHWQDIAERMANDNTVRDKS